MRTSLCRTIAEEMIPQEFQPRNARNTREGFAFFVHPVVCRCPISWACAEGLPRPDQHYRGSKRQLKIPVRGLQPRVNLHSTSVLQYENFMDATRSQIGSI